MFLPANFCFTMCVRPFSATTQGKLRKTSCSMPWRPWKRGVKSSFWRLLHFHIRRQRAHRTRIAQHIVADAADRETNRPGSVAFQLDDVVSTAKDEVDKRFSKCPPLHHLLVHVLPMLRICQFTRFRIDLTNWHAGNVDAAPHGD